MTIIDMTIIWSVTIDAFRRDIDMIQDAKMSESETGERDPIEYLLNSMEFAGHSATPFANGYGAKRKAVLSAIADLRGQLAAAKQRLATMREAFEKSSTDEENNLRGQLAAAKQELTHQRRRTADLDRWRQIARKHGVLLEPPFDPSEQRWNDHVLAAIAEAVAAERERWAKICDGMEYGINCAAAIRQAEPDQPKEQS